MPTAAERAAAREARKQANREAWAANPLNANAERERARAAAIAILADVPDAAESGSLVKLRAIMADQNRPIYQRLEAAEVVVSYEVAPASLIDVPADQVAAGSFQFMRAVADAADTPEPLRFRALKCLASIENARAARTDPGQAAAQRELLIAMISGARRMEYVRAGCWPQVCSAGQDWSLRATDTFPEPSLPSAGSVLSIGAALDAALARPAADAAARHEARREALLAIKAQNRDDDWQSHLRPDAAI